jgi:hypothetical protein
VGRSPYLFERRFRITGFQFHRELVARRNRARPSALQVSFGTDEPREKLVYVVYYEIDPARKRGYAYLPGAGDDAYLLNTGSVLRDVEGRWFRSWSEWDRLASPLIAIKD